MAEFPKLPLWTDAYLGDTLHLTTIEHGAYLLLLITMWRTKTTSLPDDDRMLARYTRLTAAQWRRIKPTLQPFFDVKNGAWTQGRLTDEREAVRQHCNRQSSRAKARWLKTKETGDATAMPRECHTLSLPSPTVQVKREANASTKKGTRLPSDWSLPKQWGDWAISEGLSDEAIRLEADKFADYWHSLPGQRAVKIDWLATWRNWCRNSNTMKPRKANGHDEEFATLMRIAADTDRREEADSEMDDGAGLQPDAPFLAGRDAG